MDKTLRERFTEEQRKKQDAAQRIAEDQGTGIKKA